METRQQSAGAIIKRRHLCGNDHRFWTFQLHEAVVRNIGLKQLKAKSETGARGVARRTLAFQRKRRVTRLLGKGLSVGAVAMQLSITDARVRQLRAEIAQEAAANTPVV